jgi:ferredoxin-like protein FixX|tara:strand:+ start:1019 stop:1243 length:225 start_codon:yes stop_codon:yes gene_type:complete
MMEIDGQIKLGHLLLADRKCRVCGETKNLVDGFYRTRKDRGAVASSYSYECKECTIQRIIENKKCNNLWEYPDW